MLSLARKLGGDLADALLDGERHRGKAVRERDLIKLACIQDRLSDMNLMKKMSDDRLAALDRPSTRADDLSARHEFRGIELALDRVTELHRDLLECVGESLDHASPEPQMPKIERPVPANPRS